MQRSFSLPSIITGCFFFLRMAAFGQSIDASVASDPVTMRTQAFIDAESYFFYGGAKYYGLRLGYNYGLTNGKHLFGMSIPFVHNIFNADYGGFENTTGIGDLKMSYLFVPYFEKNTIGLERVSFAFDVTAPTGEYALGRGAGTWLYKPGLILTMRSSAEVAFYPEMRFQVSGGEGNSTGGSDGIPDQDAPDQIDKVKNLSVAFPMVVQVKDWDGWFSLNVLYTRSFTEKTGFLFVRTDFGKMVGKNTSAALQITKFIAGQPRLNVIVQANFSFFMNR